MPVVYVLLEPHDHCLHVGALQGREGQGEGQGGLREQLLVPQRR